MRCATGLRQQGLGNDTAEIVIVVAAVAVRVEEENVEVCRCACAAGGVMDT